MIRTNAEMEAKLSDFFEKTKSRSQKLRPIIERWQSCPEGEKVNRSLMRQTKKYCKDKEAWRGIFVGWDISYLLMKIQDWLVELEFVTPLRPRERQEAIIRVLKNATQLNEDLHLLRLPGNSAEYLSNSELYDRTQQLFSIFDNNELSESEIDFKRDIKEYIRTFAYDYPAVCTDLLTVLSNLTHYDLLDELAEPATVSKVDSQTMSRVFMIRKLAERFNYAYGKTLQQTIANVCVLIFDDPMIDRDTVRSALDGYTLNEYPQKLLNQQAFMDRFSKAQKMKSS